jgi:hypothetical protein
MEIPLKFSSVTSTMLARRLGSVLTGYGSHTYLYYQVTASNDLGSFGLIRKSFQGDAPTWKKKAVTKSPIGHCTTGFTRLQK